MAKKTLFFNIIIFLTLSIKAYAGSIGTSGATFLKIIPGPRAQAMGGAYVAVAEGISGIHWNPAGLALINKKEFSTLYMRWLGDIDYGFIGYAQPIGENISLGFSGIYLMTKVEGRDIIGQRTDDVRFSNTAGTINFSCLFSDFTWGMNVRYIQEDFTSEKAAGYAFDLGNLYSFNQGKFKLGLAAQNLGAKIGTGGEKDSLPLNFKIGFAVFPWENKFIFAFDTNFPNDNNTRFNLGVEYSPVDSLALRTGYRINYDQKGINAMSFGLGIAAIITEEISGSLDLAYLPYGDLGNTYNLAYTIRF